MASILKVDELQGITAAGDITVTSEGGAATQSLQQGLAKSWVNFNGTGTIAARDSVNVASLTDNGTGDYSVNFSNDMGNANYAWSGVGDYTAGGAEAGVINQRGTLSTSSSQFSGLKLGATYTRFDTGYSIKIHGDLA